MDRNHLVVLYFIIATIAQGKSTVDNVIRITRWRPYNTQTRVWCWINGYGYDGIGLKGIALDVPDIAQLVERLTVDQLVVCSIHTVRI